MKWRLRTATPIAVSFILCTTAGWLLNFLLRACFPGQISTTKIVLAILLPPAVITCYYIYPFSRTPKTELPVNDRGRTISHILLRTCEIYLLLWVCITISIIWPRPHIQSPESAATGNLRTILGAENQYHQKNNCYGTLEELQAGPYVFLDGDWTDIKQGYIFTITIGDDGKSFDAVAIPGVIHKGQKRGFFVDETGVIRYTKDVQKERPNKDSTPIGEPAE